MKALFTPPAAVVALVITGAADWTARTRVAVPVPPAFVALTLTLDVPELVAVPEIKPVLAFTASPAGKPVAPKLVGLLVAVI